jgi:hypothetical protein
MTKPMDANDILRAYGLDALREAIDDPATDLDIGTTGNGATSPEPSADFDDPVIGTDATDGADTGEPYSGGNGADDEAASSETTGKVQVLPGIASGNRGTLLSRCAAEITPEKIEWLWPGRLAIGKHTCIAGEPGAGRANSQSLLSRR